MPAKGSALELKLSNRFLKSYEGLPAAKQSDCCEALESLRHGHRSSGLRVKPIMPANYFYEARINSGDRIVFRREGGALLVHDVVSHDQIEHFGYKPKDVR